MAFTDWLVKVFTGGYSEKVVKRHLKTVVAINALEPEIKKLSDSELAHKTVEFRERLDAGETLEDILPEAFAVVRETAVRILGQRHYDVQLVGGIVLHEGNIAEMKTGEGKTLVATLPAYLNALSGKGVHVVTVNDYLARRDSEWMGQIYRFLGLNVGLIVQGLDSDDRRVSYGADITYGTNNEFGFDYLRDNMAFTLGDMVQRGHNFCIVDEVDSILIDEARTPLIISGSGQKPTDLYYQFAKIAERLLPEEDYTVDEKTRQVAPTETGVAKVEKLLNIEHLYDDEHMEYSHYLQNAIKAKELFKLDRDYVVKDGEVIIVDEFTGRLMFGRRWSDGLHQAVEAKEGVTIERESQTLATITFQNYFRMYKKLAGMTGTAMTEEDEFRQIYKLDVISIPTNKPNVRADLPDVVYKTVKAKYKAAVEEIVERHKNGQPLLVGTVSVEKSEILSDMLRRRGVQHQVLNAKYHEREADIVAQAGRFNGVTIATNMAGRGTDILLGGNPAFLAKERLKAQGLDKEQITRASEGLPSEDPEIIALQQQYKELLHKFEVECSEDARKVREAGGLHIIGTERHESRRIDNQLRGRAGRQGDPGSTRFYVALEDDLMRLFGGDTVRRIMDRLGLEEDVPIDSPMVSRAIENAQKKVEARNFDTRKHVLQYDDVMNQQRELIYSQRRQVLEGEEMKAVVESFIEKVIDNLVSASLPEGVHREEWDLDGLVTALEQVFLPRSAVQAEDLAETGREGIKEHLLEVARNVYAEKERRLTSDVMRQLERVIILRTVDDKWIDQLDAMDDLREGVGLRAYGQKDPLIEYKIEAHEMFQNMVAAIQEDVVRAVFRLEVVREERRRPVEMQTSHGPVAANTTGPKQPVQKKKEPGRNDPCWCGSGKKYKKCHGAGPAGVA